MSQHLPVTADEITDAAVGAAEAGASIVHLHARDPADGQPSQNPDHFRPILAKTKSRTNAIINITTGGSPHMSVEDRMRPVSEFKPELASLNMGSINFGLFPMLDRYTEFRHAWERTHLENSRDLVFKNTFRDIETILNIGNANDTRFEFECYDLAHLTNLDHFRQRGIAREPLFVQSVFGLFGGVGPHPEDVLHMRRTADRLLTDKYTWSVLGAGKNQMPVATMSAAMGGNVRVGLEDSLWIGPGQLAQSNAEQVYRIRTILEALNLEVATPDETRGILSLKGPHSVAF